MKIDKESSQVPGGEAKRIEVARLLFQDKDILILDEFSSGINKETLNEIEERIFNLPKTILYVTHVYDQRLLDKVDQVIDF